MCLRRLLVPLILVGVLVFALYWARSQGYITW